MKTCFSKIIICRIRCNVAWHLRLYLNRTYGCNTRGAGVIAMQSRILLPVMTSPKSAVLGTWRQFSAQLTTQIHPLSSEYAVLDGLTALIRWPEPCFTKLQVRTRGVGCTYQEIQLFVRENRRFLCEYT